MNSAPIRRLAFDGSSGTGYHRSSAPLLGDHHLSRITLVSMFLIASGLTVATQALAQTDLPSTKSPALAVGLSLLGTVAPLALVEGPGGLAMGLILGPNLGDFYIGEYGYALGRTAVRGAILAGTVGAAVAICSGGGCGIGIFNDDDGTLVVAGIVVLGGIVATGVLGAREITNVDDRTREKNARSAPRIRVTPTVDVVRRGVGMAVGIRF